MTQASPWRWLILSLMYKWGESTQKKHTMSECLELFAQGKSQTKIPYLYLSCTTMPDQDFSLNFLLNSSLLVCRIATDWGFGVCVCVCDSTEAWTQGLSLARQVLYYLSHASSLCLFVLETESHYMPRLTLNLSSSHDNLLSAVIISVHHHTQLQLIFIY
jgi:hypothetical protein